MWALWPAMIKINALASDLTARHCHLESRICPDSAAARLRCPENGFGSPAGTSDCRCPSACPRRSGRIWRCPRAARRRFRARATGWRRDGVTLHGWLLARWAARQRLNGPRAKDGRRTLLRARQGSRQLIASWELDVDDRRPFVRQPWRLLPGFQAARVLAQLAGHSRQVSKLRPRRSRCVRSATLAG